MRLVTLLILLLPVSIAYGEDFSAKSFDLGVVVSDLDKSVEFYTKALRMKEIPGFSVPGKYSGEIGLTDSKPLTVRVLVLGDGPGASKLKLMQIGDTKSEKPKNEFIHSTLGFSYLTLGVTDTTAAMERLKKAGIKTVKQTPKALPAPLPTSVFLTIVRDPDGNFVELVGPKK